MLSLTDGGGTCDTNRLCLGFVREYTVGNVRFMFKDVCESQAARAERGFFLPMVGLG